MARRKKQAALSVPQSMAEAVAVIGEYAETERRARGIVEAADKAIAAIKSETDAAIAALQPEQNGRFASIKAWWEASGHTVAGSRRSAELAGAKLGFRLGTPKVKFDKGVSAPDVFKAMVKAFPKAAFQRFVETKISLNRKAMIAARDEIKIAGYLGKLPLQIVQDDEFFIEAGPANAPTETVAAESDGDGQP